MTNMESLYNEFEQYFNDNRERINYFLEVLKNVKEDRLEYKCFKKAEYGTEHEIFSLKYDNIVIMYEAYIFWSESDADVKEKIRIYVGKTKIFETDNADSELAIEIIDFIERAEKRVKGE